MQHCNSIALHRARITAEYHRTLRNTGRLSSIIALPSVVLSENRYDPYSAQRKSFQSPFHLLYITYVLPFLSCQLIGLLRETDSMADIPLLLPPLDPQYYRSLHIGPWSVLRRNTGLCTASHLITGPHAFLDYHYTTCVSCVRTSPHAHCMHACGSTDSSTFRIDTQDRRRATKSISTLKACHSLQLHTCTTAHTPKNEYAPFPASPQSESAAARHL